MTVRLRHKQTAAMFALLVLAREVSNKELQEVVGFRLDGKEKAELNKRQLVSSQPKERGLLYHELTENGRAWCRDELKAKTPPPPSRSTLADAMYVVLDGIDSYLSRQGLTLDDIFPSDAELTAEEIEHRIRTAYHKLAKAPRDWVALAALRPRLGNAPAVEVDAVLKELSRTGQAHLSPTSNRKVLTAADHAAALSVGGQDTHRLVIEVP